MPVPELLAEMAFEVGLTAAAELVPAFVPRWLAMFLVCLLVSAGLALAFYVVIRLIAPPVLGANS